MAERTVSVRLTANVTGFLAGMRAAGKAAGDVADRGLDKIEKRKAALNDVAGTVGVLGATLTGAGLAAVGVAAKFDSAMSGVRAATRASTQDMGRLREAALQAGADTAFSASEAAAGIEQLGRAGVSTEAILGGGLRGALDLAAAGTLEVADAAELTAIALQQFQLSGDQASHVADLLAAGAGKAMGEVSDLGMALKQGALPAAQLGISIEETVGALAAFANAGLIGSDAGTSFKTMLQSLTPNSEKAKETMEELGLSFFDAQGNFVGLQSVAAQLQEKLGGLTEQQRATTLETIFGSDAVRAATVLYEQGAQGVAEWTTKVNDQGYAAEQAGIKLDNLKGDLEAFRGSFETALIKGGEGGQGALRSLVQWATDAVNSFNSMSSAAQNTTLAIVGGGGLALLGVAGIAKLAIVAADTYDAFKRLNGETGRLSRGLGAVARYGGAAVAALGGFALIHEWFALGADEVDRYVNSVLRAANSGDIDSQIAALSAEIDKQRAIVDDAAIAWEFWGGGIFSGDAADAADRIDALNKRLAQLREEQADAADAAAEQAAANRSANVTMGQVALQAEQANRALKEQREAWRGALNGAQEYSEGILAMRDAQRGFEQSLDDAGERLEQRKRLLGEAAEAQRRLNAAESPEDKAAAREELARINEELDRYAAGLDKSTQAGRDNQAALDGIASAAHRVIEDMEERNVGEEKIRGQYVKSREELRKMAERFGMTKAEAKKYVDQVLKIPRRYQTTIEVKGLGEAMGLTKQWDKLLKDMDGRKIRVTVGAVNRLNAAGFAHGGWTGDVPTNVVAGVTHGQEFVVKAGPARQHRELLEAINAGRLLRGYAQGGFVGSSGPQRVFSGPINVHQTFLREPQPADAVRAALRATEYQLQ